MMIPRVLIACEFSGTVREAFLARGFDAWSCDLRPAERLVRSGRGGTIRRIARDRALVSVSAAVEAEIADVVAAQAAAWGQAPGEALRNLILMGIGVARDEAA